MKELLDRADIIGYLGEVAEELSDGSTEEVVIVGGSMLAIRGLREATRDVDTASGMSQQLQGAATRVADRHDLAPGWLNSNAAGFVPYGEVDIVDPEPVLITPTLRVFTATADVVFLMKLFAGRPQDHDDLVALWPRCSFVSPQVLRVTASCSRYPQRGVQLHRETRRARSELRRTDSHRGAVTATPGRVAASVGRSGL